MLRGAFLPGAGGGGVGVSDPVDAGPLRLPYEVV